MMFTRGCCRSFSSLIDVFGIKLVKVAVDGHLARRRKLFLRGTSGILRDDQLLKRGNHMRDRSANVGKIGLLDGLLEQRFKQRTQAAVARTTLVVGGNQTTDVLL